MRPNPVCDVVAGKAQNRDRDWAVVLMDSFPVMREKHCVIHLGVIRPAAINPLFAKYVEYSSISRVVFVSTNAIKTENFLSVFVSGEGLCHQVDSDVFCDFLSRFHIYAFEILSFCWLCQPCIDS